MELRLTLQRGLPTVLKRIPKRISELDWISLWKLTLSSLDMLRNERKERFIKKSKLWNWESNPRDYSEEVNWNENGQRHWFQVSDRSVKKKKKFQTNNTESWRRRTNLQTVKLLLLGPKQQNKKVPEPSVQHGFKLHWKMLKLITGQRSTSKIRTETLLPKMKNEKIR